MGSLLRTCLGACRTVAILAIWRESRAQNGRVVLRTGRFFPEEDDMAHKIFQSGENTKANEFLFRRLTVEDAAEAHIAALARAPKVGFDTFIISALTPFHPADCERSIVPPSHHSGRSAG